MWYWQNRLRRKRLLQFGCQQHRVGFTRWLKKYYSNWVLRLITFYLPEHIFSFSSLWFSYFGKPCKKSAKFPLATPVCLPLPVPHSWSPRLYRCPCPGLPARSRYTRATARGSTRGSIARGRNWRRRDTTLYREWWSSTRSTSRRPITSEYTLYSSRPSNLST